MLNPLRPDFLGQKLQWGSSPLTIGVEKSKTESNWCVLIPLPITLDQKLGACILLQQKLPCDLMMSSGLPSPRSCWCATFVVLRLWDIARRVTPPSGPGCNVGCVPYICPPLGQLMQDAVACCLLRVVFHYWTIWDLSQPIVQSSLECCKGELPSSQLFW
jgi:hypothetical protein